MLRVNLSTIDYKKIISYNFFILKYLPIILKKINQAPALLDFFKIPIDLSANLFNWSLFAQPKKHSYYTVSRSPFIYNTAKEHFSKTRCSYTLTISFISPVHTFFITNFYKNTIVLILSWLSQTTLIKVTANYNQFLFL